MNFQCVKCKESYLSDEDDAYYCPSCLIEKQELAKKLDKQAGPRVKVKSELELYDEAVRANGGKFPNYKSLPH